MTNPNCRVCSRPIGPGGAKGLCAADYQRTRRGLSLDTPLRERDGTSGQLSLRHSADEVKAWTKAAKRAGMALREWIRKVLSEAS
jgi:hypothetical protein